MEIPTNVKHYANQAWGIAKREGGARLDAILSIVDEIFTIPNAIGAIGQTCTSIVSLGLNEKRNLSACEKLQNSCHIISNLFPQIIRFINPEIAATSPLSLNNYDTGKEIIKYAARKLNICLKNDNFIVVRLKFVALAVATIVARVIQTILACGCVLGTLTKTVVALPSSFISNKTYLGFIKDVDKWNKDTCIELRSPAVIMDLFVCTIGFINPSKGTNLLNKKYGY